ncbi:hypothetical protein DEJ23_12610 [Curtobacterium sp. MCSS17_008]|uniref:hypothetical protein n=1 Tax=Curtobacterium sp. MCSS17_008 TaxID=2175647 RepID=UPI000DA87C70|nr:hypothetical protein [Curtobacterium sp. MCSS17_008]PZF55323.1 hypothetical protein DEJ23_12610 [Curtobacterium sp. MCSS17_008]
METRDEVTAEEAPPGWVLSTPTRFREVWDLPLLALVLAGVTVVVGAAFGDLLALVTGVVTAVIVAAGAVALFVTARRAYVEQTWGASWDLHRTRVVVGVTAGAVVMVGSLVVGILFATVIGTIGAVAQIKGFARSVPRFDHSAVASAFLAVTGACVVLVVLGLALPEQPVLPGWRAAVWVGGAGAFAVFAAVLALVSARRAAAAPLE